MARIDPLLRMMAAQGGDELVLVAGEAPRLSQAGAALRFFLPPMTDAMLRGLVESVVDERTWGAFQRGEAITAACKRPDLGLFAVQARADGGRTELVLRRVPETPPEPQVPPPLGDPPAIVQAPTPVALADLEGLLMQALERGASDVHLATGEEPTLRVDGRLVTVPGNGDALLAALLVPARRAALEADGAHDFALELPGRARFRANVYRHAGGEAAALRVLTRAAPTLKQLEFPFDLEPLTRFPHGLVLVCGPTGSGKTTTLAALIRQVLETRGGALITLEDPIEYTYQAPRGALVRQRQLGDHARDFVAGLRDALREDPDILLIGEMRDRASIELALTAAETGHLVFTTLHTRSAAAAIDRILDSFPAERHAQLRQQLADATRAIVSQRLLPRSRGDGRVPAVEVLRATTGVQALIREGRTSGLASALQGGGADGMIPLERCLGELVRRGQITRAAAEAAANDQNALTEYLR
ncbi:MAG: PilT/PilU family type 4a pilus ATPase [bacterium]